MLTDFFVCTGLGDESMRVVNGVCGTLALKPAGASPVLIAAVLGTVAAAGAAVYFSQ